LIIDCHVHLLHEKGYLEKLIDTCDETGIDKVCLLGGPANYKLWGHRHASNDEVLEAAQKYPERIIPFGFFDLGYDSPSLVDRLYEAGFKGLKITRPRIDYDDREAYPVYSRTTILQMPILFHVGTVVRTEWDHLLDIRCDRMRPIRLDTIARAFPTQNIIGAHLGNPWYEEACMSLFWNYNLYFDLSGTVIKRKKIEWFKDMLWWDEKIMEKMAFDSSKSIFPVARNKSHPWERICFGSDTPLEEIGTCLKDYQILLNDLQIPEEIKNRVLGGNIEKMLKLNEEKRE